MESFQGPGYVVSASNIKTNPLGLFAEDGELLIKNNFDYFKSVIFDNIIFKCEEKSAIDFNNSKNVEIKNSSLAHEENNISPPITLKDSENIRFSSIASPIKLFSMDECSGIVFEDCTIIVNDIIIKNSDDIIFKNCTIKSKNQDVNGVRLWSCDDITFNDCTIKNMESGLKSRNTENIKLVNTVIKEVNNVFHNFRSSIDIENLTVKDYDELCKIFTGTKINKIKDSKDLKNRMALDNI